MNSQVLRSCTFVNSCRFSARFLIWTGLWSYNPRVKAQSDTLWCRLHALWCICESFQSYFISRCNSLLSAMVPTCQSPGCSVFLVSCYISRVYDYMFMSQSWTMDVVCSGNQTMCIRCVLWRQFLFWVKMADFSSNQPRKTPTTPACATNPRRFHQKSAQEATNQPCKCLRMTPTLL